MVHVIASVRVKAGKVSDYLGIVKENMLKVREEKGSIEYAPAVDLDAGLPAQVLDGQAVTIIEKWESLESLHDHLKSAHMAAYRDKVKDMVEGVSLKILREA